MLFDEIEKAHPDVMNILLQILEDGILTDSQGRTVSFKNCVIIMTSNIGARQITEKKKLGFSNNTFDEDSDYLELKKSVNDELKKELKPEFINRIDEIVIFHKLTRKEIGEIIEIMLRKVKQRLLSQNYFVEFDESIKNLIAEKTSETNYGARPIRRTVQNLIEDKIAEGILNHEIDKNEKIIVYEKDNQISFEMPRKQIHIK